MSLDVSATTVLGVKLKLSEFKIKKKCFEHNYPEDFEFDPKTGKPLWHQTSSLYEIAEQIGLDSFSPDPDNDDSYAYIGVKIPDGTTEFDFRERAKEISRRIVAAGLPNAVGIHTILNYHY